MKGRMRWPRHGVAITCHCPHCGMPAAVRTSKAVSPTLRAVAYACCNQLCGHAFVVYAEAVRTLSPSARPDPSVYLPMGREARDAIAGHATMKEPDGRELPLQPEQPYALRR